MEDLRDFGTFTFHYVSIKTAYHAGEIDKDTHLHSTMYLLKRGQRQLWKLCKGIYIPLCIY